MKNREEVFAVIEDIRQKICDCRLGVSYISNDYDPYDELDKSPEQIYASGVKAGIYDGLEMALGLLETVEDYWVEEENADL